MTGTYKERATMAETIIAPTDSESWPDLRNRGLLQAAKQAEAALTKYIQTPEPRDWKLLYEAQSYLRPAIKREEAWRAAFPLPPSPESKP
jgi:hypothetical protein